jgi:uracil-DNA glycosylase family 4
MGWNYWGKPLPGYGDPQARLLVAGLAPAAHGANRTGRMFTGDSSGDFLARAMHDQGFAALPTSRCRDDGQRLLDAYITAVVRCAPPDNKPLPEETRNCLPYLEAELRLLPTVRVILALGRFAWEGVWAALRNAGVERPSPRPSFGHGVQCSLPHPFCRRETLSLFASYHPSRQNTNTGRLTPSMLQSVLARCREKTEVLLTAGIA